MADVVDPIRSPPGAGESKIPPALSPSNGGIQKSTIQRLLVYRLLLLLAIGILAADQLTKAWIASRLPFETYREVDGAIPVIRGFFYLVHVGNTGAAWSMFTGKSVFLAALAAVTLVAIYFWRRALGLHDRIAQISFGLLCGGIAGNLIDRLLHGHVIDFIDLHFGDYVYPTFNVADSGICIGVLLYLWHSLRAPR
jgi:signal peptidase II